MNVGIRHYIRPAVVNVADNDFTAGYCGSYKKPVKRQNRFCGRRRLATMALGLCCFLFVSLNLAESNYFYTAASTNAIKDHPHFLQFRSQQHFSYDESNNHSSSIEQDSLELSPENNDPLEQKRLPSCIIIGVRKCGTRALMEFLSLHPAIRAARFEVHFFDNQSNYAQGIDWYRDQMPNSSSANQITLEKTPAYFVSPAAPGRLRSVLPSAKLLLIVRNPVTRTVSDYTQVHFTKLARGKAHPSLPILGTLPNGTINAKYKPIRNSLYHQHILPWLAEFPLERIHVANGDNFIRDPLSELRRIEAFLGIPPRISAQQIYFNETKGFFCYYGASGGASCLGDSKGRPHVDVDPQFLCKLREFFLPFNEQFFALVNKRFDW